MASTDSRSDSGTPAERHRQVGYLGDGAARSPACRPRASRAARGPRPSQTRQLGPARQVLGRRRERLRRQPGRLHDAGQGVRASTTSSRRVLAFCVAVTNNFLWNRHWTFRATDGHMGFQAARFFTVSVLALGLNLIVLAAARQRRRRGQGRRAGDRNPRRDPAQLHRQQALELRRARTAALAVALACGLLGARPLRRRTRRRPRPRSQAVRPDATSRAPSSPTRPPRDHFLNAVQAARHRRRARRSCGRSCASTTACAATTFAKGPGRWQVSWYADGDEIAQVIVDEREGRAIEVWTGPQVAWQMARGLEGAFGRKVNAPLDLDPADARVLHPVLRSAAAAAAWCTSTCWCCCPSPSRTSSSTAARSSRRYRSCIRCSSICWCAC